MKKRILSIFLTVAMVIALLPQTMISVKAADPVPVYGVLTKDGFLKAEAGNPTTPIISNEEIDKKTITNLFVAEGVATIDSGTFKNCNALTTVDMPSVTTIGVEAFMSCTALTTVEMPSVNSIGKQAFQSCLTLTAVDISNLNTINEMTFYACYALETVTMPAVTSIGKSAFGFCKKLVTVDMPAVTSIGKFAFERCEKLVTVTMPIVTSIESGAFRGCIALETVTMPKVASIIAPTKAPGDWDGAFKDCKSLKNLTVGATPPTTVDPKAFVNCPTDRNLTIDKGNTAEAVKPYIEANDGNQTDSKWFGWSLSVALDITKGPIKVEDGTGNTIKVTYNDGVQKTVDNLPADIPIIITGTTDKNTVTVDTPATKPINITLSGVNIDVNLREEACAFDIQNNSDVNLTLADGTTNTLKSGKNRAGLQVNSNDTKTITATVNINGKGSLNATGGKWGPGIGGGASSVGGNIIINDGIITATGGSLSAGIGCGKFKPFGNITINGGTIFATGGINAAGIGFGYTSGSGSGEIIISGGNVTAIGGWKGQGIGEGTGMQSSGATIKIDNDANVIAVLGYEAEKEAIGSVTGPSASGKTVANILRAKYSTDLDVGTTIAVKNSNGEDLTPSVKYKTVGTTKSIAFSVKNTGDYTVYNGDTQAEKQQAHKNDTTNGKFNVVAGLNIFEEVKEYTVPVIPTIPASLDISKGSITVSDGTTPDTIKVIYNDGAGKTVDNLPMNTEIVITGTTTSNAVIVNTAARLADNTTTKTVKITLKDANINVISIDKKSAFDIQGAAVVSLTLDGNSTLKSGSNQAGLQVQRKDDQTATVTINGTGALNATGYRGGAGIGSGVNNPGNINNGGGNITIGGANVTATGGELGAGIGGGTNSTGGDITISGGTVISTGGSSGAGIGGGHEGQIGNIIIGGATVIATGGQNAAGIGRGGSSSIMPLIGYVKIDDTSNIIAVSTGQKDAIDGDIEGNILIAQYKKSINANTATTLRDVNGNDLSTPVTYTPTSSYQSIAFSGLKNSTYTLYNGDTQQVHGKYYQNKIFDVSGAEGTRFYNVQDYVAPPTEYKVTVNNGTGGKDYAVGVTVNITANQPDQGKRFKEWTVVSGGVTLASSTAETTTFIMPANPVVVEAKYEDVSNPQTYTITFDANKGTGIMLPQLFTHGTPSALTSNLFTNTGYTFKEWNTSADGKGLPYSNGASYIASDNATLYAQWTNESFSITGTVEDDDNNKVSGAIVKLMKGNKQIGESVKTNSQGEFSISNVSNSTYNLVVSKDGIVVTTIIVVSGNDFTTGTIMLPSGKTNSVVEVKPNTPQIVVGNLEKQFSDEDKAHIKGNPTNKVEIKLVAEKKDKTAVKEEADKITAVANGKTIGLYLDLSVFKTLTTNSVVGTSEKQPTMPKIIEIVVPLPAELQGKSGLVVYRVHNGNAQALPKDDANADGEYFKVIGNEMRIYTKNFSTYAIGFDKSNPVNPPSTSTIPVKNFSEIEKLIIDLPTAEDFKETDISAFEKVEKEYNKLTNEEKSLIDETLHNKYKVILKQVEAMRKVTDKPSVVKPLPPKKPAPNPQTGDNTPLEFPITFATLGLALMALGLFLKGKGKKRS